MAIDVWYVKKRKIYLGTIHKRSRPIFPNLWPSSLPLSPHIAYGMINPRGDVVFEVYDLPSPDFFLSLTRFLKEANTKGQLISKFFFW